MYSEHDSDSIVILNGSATVSFFPNMPSADIIGTKGIEIGKLVAINCGHSLLANVYTFIKNNPNKYYAVMSIKHIDIYNKYFTFNEVPIERYMTIDQESVILTNIEPKNMQ